jgi:type II secretory pathway pseudopilin PulG
MEMLATSKAGARAPEQAGYTFVSVLVVMVALAIGAQAAFLPSKSAQVRNREVELIFRGFAYRDAIASYWRAGGQNLVLPTKLETLVSDPRPDAPRHLRRLYPDPVTGGDWALIRDEAGGITGVTSSSPLRPRKNALFPEGLEHFKGARTYASWTFIFTP